MWFGVDVLRNFGDDVVSICLFCYCLVVLLIVLFGVLVMLLFVVCVIYVVCFGGMCEVDR